MIAIEYTLYGVFLLTVLFSFYAQMKVSVTFRKYSSSYTAGGKTASSVAAGMLAEAGVFGVRIGRCRGHLSDHFDPRSNSLNLSESVYDSTSCAAIGVAAHEAGHAIQHAKGYFPLKLRSVLVPTASFASRAAWLFIMAGILLTGFYTEGGIGYYLLLFGVGLFSVTTLFQLLTLPCEFNASARALEFMRSSGDFTSADLTAAIKVLSAASMTYVAATLASLVQLLRLVVILTGRKGRR
jgi:Zn-dependent membrane protease YugP